MGTEKLTAEMKRNALLVVRRGSIVYGTRMPGSDIDILAVVPDDYRDFLSHYENGIFQEPIDENNYEPVNDWQFVSLSDFKQMAKDHTVLAMETMCTPPDEIVWNIWYDNLEFAKSLLPLDKWKIRQQFSGTSSNSWAKAHKKMTVEKDYDIYKAKKSLFHSLRILMFAIQLCEREQIYDFKEAKPLWDEIILTPEYYPWEYYKKKYRPMYNSLRSKLAELAPKPKNS